MATNATADGEKKGILHKQFGCSYGCALLALVFGLVIWAAPPRPKTESTPAQDLARIAGEANNVATVQSFDQALDVMESAYPDMSRRELGDKVWALRQILEKEERDLPSLPAFFTRAARYVADHPGATSTRCWRALAGRFSKRTFSLATDSEVSAFSGIKP